MMPWRSMANFFGMCRYVHPRISGRLATVPLGLSLVNRRGCLRFLGPVRKFNSVRQLPPCTHHRHTDVQTAPLVKRVSHLTARKFSTLYVVDALAFAIICHKQPLPTLPGGAAGKAWLSAAALEGSQGGPRSSYPLTSKNEILRARSCSVTG